MKQRALKNIADSRGVLLRPQDSNAVGGASGGKKKILGAGKKRAAGPGAARSAGGLLGAGGRGGGGDVDPLAKKVKVRFFFAVPCVDGKHQKRAEAERWRSDVRTPFR